ncbi:hypothetical protein TMS3_0116380 [Pseudomonas taeanensis MS-3]|uniref:HNH nuclease domain-containing protein n=1 Tax=Pseudomonas taeanensis MS-3 TaxID=1395571 RepID=A0A0A1YIZ1_9PSED|nr:HNH endonuclease [Pseudomonas taeanensis]KFX69056.1 hypothetical protein TMS3_0116380 [Pseudomonas taeanensis MS-3]
MTSIATNSPRNTASPIVYRFPLDNTEAVFEFDFQGSTARTLADFPGYAFTADGHVLSFKGKAPAQLKPGSSASGCYCYVNIGRPPFKKSQLLHILVARAFVTNPEGKPQVNHKDGNPGNNAAGNLEWVTPSENVLHANQLRKEQGRSLFKTTAEQRSLAKALHASGLSIAEVGRQLNLPYEIARYAVRYAKPAPVLAI